MKRRKKNVLLVQPNYQYGTNLVFPYSIGTLQAYAETIPAIKENFHFLEPIFSRVRLNEIFFSQVPDIVAFSCYIWNWEYNNVLAKKIRSVFPKSLIIFGGPQVPNASADFFLEHPYADILVHNEGEISFADILVEFLFDRPDYTKIPGLSVRARGNRAIKTPPRMRTRDLSCLPSPYVAGVFDFLLNKGLPMHTALQETNRGCPYQCQYCDWGSNTYNKVIQFDEKRILEEFEWFGRNKVEYIFNCDSNFGIFPRDVVLAEKMIEIRERCHGYPSKFRICTAKKSDERVFEITKLLSAVGMSKGATLSFQSMNDKTLEIIRRKNIKIEDFQRLMEKYHEAGIQTYTELILGLPGETYESMKHGVDMLIDAQEDAVNLCVFICILLPNAGLSQPDFIEKYGIISSRVPAHLQHSTPNPEDVQEYNRMIVGTNSMPPKDWIRALVFCLIIQGLYCFGPTKHISILFRRLFGIRYSDFYEAFAEYFMEREETHIGKQMKELVVLAEGARDGGHTDMLLPEFENIFWPMEEAFFLQLMKEKDQTYREIREFIGDFAAARSLNADETLLDDLVLYQSGVMVDPFVGEREISLRYDFYEYFCERKDRTADVLQKPVKLKIIANRNFAGDLKEYGNCVPWYGRRGGKFHHTNITRVTE